MYLWSSGKCHEKVHTVCHLIPCCPWLSSSRAARWWQGSSYFVVFWTLGRTLKFIWLKVQQPFIFLKCASTMNVVIIHRMRIYHSNQQQTHHVCFSVSRGPRSWPSLRRRRHSEAPQTSSCCRHIRLHNAELHNITITSPYHCPPVTRKLPPMLTPRRFLLGEGRCPVRCQADVPRVRTSVEERMLSCSAVFPPVTTYTCITHHDNISNS